MRTADERLAEVIHPSLRLSPEDEGSMDQMTNAARRDQSRAPRPPLHLVGDQASAFAQRT
jgi:hypothetical protein